MDDVASTSQSSAIQSFRKQTDKEILRRILGDKMLHGPRYSHCRVSGANFDDPKEIKPAAVTSLLEAKLESPVVFLRKRKHSDDEDVVKAVFFDVGGQEDAAVKLGFFACEVCHKTFSGCGSASRHNCQVKRSRSTGGTPAHGPLDQYVVAEGGSDPTFEEKSRMTEAVADWLATSSRPFRIAEDPGLARVIEEAQKTALKHGCVVTAKKLLPSRTTVSSRQSKYYSVNVAMIRCDPDEDKGHETVWKQLVQAVRPYSVDEGLLRSLHCASDQGSNITKALRVFSGNNVHCICHVINTVSKRAFEPYKEASNAQALLLYNDMSEAEKELVKKGNLVLKNVLKLVNNAKGTYVEHALGQKLPGECATRWLTKLEAVNAVRDNEDVLLGLRAERDFAKKAPKKVVDSLDFLVANWSLLDDVQSILAQFQEMLNNFQTHSCDIHNVWWKWVELRASLELMCEASTEEMQAALAKSAVKCMLWKQEEGVISKFHKVAMLLNPNTRQLNGVVESDSEYQEVVAELKSMVRSGTGTSTSQESTSASARPKNRFFDQPRSHDVPTDEEVDEYLKANLRVAENANVLDFWATQEQLGLFPNVRKLAIKVLAIPASTAVAEQTFSLLRNLLPENKSSILAETVHDTMIYRSFQPLKGNF